MKKKLVITMMLFLLIAATLTGCSKKKEKDTIRFFNATYSILTTRNNANVNVIGGYDKENELYVSKIKESLENDWGVTNEAEAKETIDWLLSEGHNKEVVQAYKDNEMEEISKEELLEILEDEDFTEEDRAYFISIYDSVKKFGDQAILAWDLSRAEQLLAWYYIAGYYTYEDAMDKSLEVAQTLQKTYSSWDEMIESYFYGYEYWAEELLENEAGEGYARKKIYEELKAKEDGPFSVDWNTELKKEW